jgi:hypothetical protein
MEEKYLYNSNVDLHVLEGLNVAMAFTDFRSELGNPRTIQPADTDEKRNLLIDSNFPSEDKNEEWNHYDFVHYGTDNQFPKNLYTIIKRNSKLKVGLGIKARNLIGLGIETGEYLYENNQKKFVPQEFNAFDTFYDRANVFRNYVVPAARALKTYFQCFVSIGLTPDGSKIAYLKVIPNHKCRLSKPTPDGKYKYCYVSNYWDKGTINVKDSKKVKPIPVIDSFFDSAEDLRKISMKGKVKEFMYVLRIPTEEDHYSLPDWVSVIEQGWVDTSNDVPTFKRWLMKNLTTVNQIMYINEKYFETQYPDWNELKKQCSQDKKDSGGSKTAFAEMQSRRKKLVDDIQEKLSGLKNSGSLITAPMLRDAAGNTAVESKAIEIETIKGTDFSERFNADANEADTQILFALEIDPSIYGNLTRTDSQGGTGKREGNDIAQASEYIFEQILLEPLYFKRDFDIDPTQTAMQFRIKRVVTPTLDAITPSQRKIDPTA